MYFLLINTFYYIRKGDIEVAACLRQYDYPGIPKSKIGKKDKHFQVKKNNIVFIFIFVLF